MASGEHPDPLSEETVDFPEAISPASRIGPYQILETLGEGGMGVVYLAEQREPVRRRVALKLIKLGMDTRDVIARFESERQALAMMNHPNVARVLDAGATAAGRPYFVMEYVSGLPITGYCDRHRLGVRERLELFIDVCAAVQHAHQKGIIHRDIKPSNVLVMLHDGLPLVKVIDFGVAKATAGRLTERTIYTEQGRLIGTPAYMSPEQAEMTGLDIDTRTDVYSLGVLLYELLVGALPFDPQALRAAGYAEMQRIIREQDPPRPSTRVSKLTAQSGEVAEKRQSEPRVLARLLRGDLDSVTMKAMEKDRTRRYATASELAADIRRHLSHEPVLACPPSVRYRVGKFLRKHRAAVIAAAAGLVAMIAALIAMTWLYFEADAAKRAEIAQRQLADDGRKAAEEAGRAAEARRVEAESERQRAADAEQDANQQRDRADEERAIAAAVTEFLQNDLLSQVDPTAQAGPDRAPDPDVRLRTVLDRAAVAIEKKFQDQPLVEASIRHTIGKTYFSIGEFPIARRHLDRALEIRRSRLGNEHRDTLAVLNNLAWLERLNGDIARAEAIFAEILQIQKRALGETHPTTVNTLIALAGMLRDLGEFDKAEPLFVEAVNLTRGAPGLDPAVPLTAINGLGALYSYRKEFAKAEPLIREALEGRQRVLGKDHPYTFNTMGVLAGIYRQLGQFDKADAIYSELLERSRRSSGDVSIQTAAALSARGLSLLKQRKFAQAEQDLQECVAIREAKLPDDWLTFHTKSLLGECVMGKAGELSATDPDGSTEKFIAAETLLLAGYFGLEARGDRIHAPLRGQPLVESLERLVRLYDAWDKPEQAAVWRKKWEAARARAPQR